MARFRFASLWLSQVARILADNCLRVFIFLTLVHGTTATTERESAWHLLAALLALPPIVLAPLNGAISNSLRKRYVLAGTALYCGAVTAVFGLAGGPWVACWALVAVGAAIYSPTRYALLPAAAEDSGLPLTRINGLIEMGAVTAIIVGWIVGGHLHGWRLLDLDAAVVLAAGLNLFALVTALPVRFHADVRRPESPGQAIAGFFRDTRRILAEPEARGSLLALASLRGLVGAMMGAILAVALGGGRFTIDNLIVDIALWIALGVAVGSLLAGVQRHPRRALGLVPIGCSGLLLGLILSAAGGVPGPVLCVILGA
ncbi:MAG TPA: MFS transporter, partial [Gemmataceae bacterium]|nr:MFS transporter [Gemmataceae bacterium]